jgi:hypothetical protein
MAEMSTGSMARAAEELDQMHVFYRRGGQERSMAPHIVYPDADCPHNGCGHPIQAIDFRLEAHGRSIHYPLIRAWWDDTGFVGCCPRCGGWIHFTIRAKCAVTAEEAARYPQLPDNWYAIAIIL